MKKHILFFIAVILSFVTVQSYGQGVNCAGATPICSGVTTTFPGTIGGTVPAGNNYGCLFTQANPSWFTFTVGSVGAITINQTAPCDQDYAVWGPFNTLSAACAGLTAAPISCSFSPASGNIFTLPTAAPGQIFIMLLSNFGGCTGNVTITESVGGGSLTCVPVCAVTASNLGPYCSGATITLNATAATGATSYTWTGPNGFTASTQNVTIPSCTAAMAGVYTVTATGAATCTGSTTVVVNPTPTMNPTVTSPVCIGSPITLCSGAPVGALVAWTGPAYAALNACPTIPSATAAMAGNYTVTVLLNGCQAQQIIPVVVSPAPTVTAVTPISLCSGGTVPATTFTGTPATATFTWTNNQPSVGLAASGNGGLPSFTATNNSANPVTATISVVPHLGTCNGTASNFTITVSPVPALTAPASNVYCEGAQFPGVTWGASAGSTISWTNSNPAIGLPASGTGNIPAFTTSQVTNQTIATIIATPSQGPCTGTPVTFNITVNNAPSATITDIGPLCSNVGFQTLVAATPGGIWSGPGIINTTSGLFNPLTAGAGTTPTITYTLNLPNQCPASDITQIQIISVPAANAGVNQSVCQGQTVNINGSFTNSNTGNETFAWTPTTNLTNTTTLTPTYTANSTQTYTLTVSSGICSSTDNVVITMLPQSNATITAAGPFCADVAPVILTAAQTGGTWSGTGITNATTGAFNPASATIGNNVITYSIGGPCPSIDTQTIVIYAVPSGAITPAGPYCQSVLPVTLTAATPGGTWSGTGINNAATGSFGSTTLAANTYAITYTTSGNCPRTFNQNIVVNASTNATINAAGPFCSDDAAVILTAAQTGGTWSGPGITNASTGAFNPGTANISNTITYSIGGPCPSTDTQVIVVNSLPDGTITPAGPFCQSSLPFTLTAASPGGAWSGTGINNTSTGSFGSNTLAASTYTVSYNTGGNCPQIFTENIVVNANTNATIAAAGPYCADVAPVVLTAAQTGGTWSGFGITSGVTGAFNPASANIGNNIITYSIGGPCPSTDTQTILIYDVPNGTITPVGPFCQSDLPITLSAASAGGTWSGTGINNTSTGNFGSTALAANTYTVTYNTGGNCSNNFTQTIVVNANVDATIAPQANICADAAPITFVAADLGGVWSGNGITNTATGAFDPASVIPNLQTITYTILGACPDSDTETIEVYAVYDGTITPAGPFCQAELPFTLTAASAGGTWTGTGINNAANGSFGSTTLASSSYAITYTTGGSCPRVFNETIIVNSNVDATISNVSALCADVAAFNLTAADAGGTWSGTGITDAIAGTFDPSVVANGTPTITYSIPGACPSSDTQDITVYAVFDGTITPVGPFCQADLPITMTAATSGGAWSGTGINDSSTGNFGSSSLAASTYTITYTTQGNCSEAFTTTIVVNANFDATISAVADVCNDAPAFNLSSIDGGGTWSGQGVNASGTFAPNSVPPATYIVTYSIGGACPDSDTQDVVVLNVPDGTITPAGPFCQDALPQTLTAASVGGTWSGTGVTSAANGTFGALSTPAGNYSITYTTPGACSNSFNQIVQVIENLNATIGSAGPFCEDASPFTLTAASAGGVWSGTGTIATNGQISPSVLGPGTYTFNYNINNSGCLSSDNVQVTVNALPQPSFTTSTTNGCSPLSVTFTNTSNPLGSSCVWYVNGAPAGNGNTLSEIFTGSSCEDIGIMITDAAGCSQSMTMTDVVCVNPNPSASFSWSPIEPMLGGTVSFENTSIGGTTYTWDINGQGASGEGVIYTVPSETDGQFTVCLEVVGPGGCMDAQCYAVVLSAESYIFVPNSFTPDDDGTNDVFAPVIVGLTSDFSYSFKVFNRWGVVIFETNDPNDVWTGNVRGGNFYAQPDAYVYEITLQLRAGEVPFKKVGSIVLIR